MCIFWKLSSRTDIKIKNIEDAKHYMIGGVLDDARATHLQKLGFVIGKNLEMVRNDSLNIEKLFGGHLDMIPIDEFSFLYKVKKSGHDFKKLTKLIKLDKLSTDLYLAASPATSDQVVKELKMALSTFKKSERYKQFRDKYNTN